MINRLGSYVHDQMALHGWSRVALVERSGIAECQLDGILQSPVLAEWPPPEVLLSLAKAFNVPAREVLVAAAEGSGLPVADGLCPADSLPLISNEDLVREVRRRVALGVASGAHVAKPGDHFDVDSGVQLS